MKNKFLFAITITILVLLSCLADAQRNGDPRYSEARFSFSSDPTKVVLHVTRATQDLTIRSMTLYGDGRLDMEVRGGSRILEQYDRILNFEEMQAVLRSVVDHGLAEWDGTRINSLFLRHRGKPYAPPSDGAQVSILISLEEYSRGGYRRPTIENSIRVIGPRFTARFFPDIVEFQGINYLTEMLGNEFARARSKNNLEGENR